MKISVVIPVYNEAATIGACLDSLQLQTRPADEIIIVDNNSTDETIAIVRGYDVTIIQEPLQSIGAASRAGMNKASGDVIARCDADSRLPNDWLAIIEQSLLANPDAVAITGPGNFYDTGKITAALAKVWYMYAYFLVVGSALAKWPLFGSNYALRQDVWLTVRDAVHYRSNDIHDDIDVTMHLPPNAKILFSRQLTVGISGRALRISNLKARYKRGIRSLTLHWPERSPVVYWASRLKR